MYLVIGVAVQQAHSTITSAVHTKITFFAMKMLLRVQYDVDGTCDWCSKKRLRCVRQVNTAFISAYYGDLRSGKSINAQSGGLLIDLVW